MHNLIRFIKLNQFLLVFILVEGLSISILINNNSFQANKLANILHNIPVKFMTIKIIYLII